jgi:pre-60S factor REI1
MLHSHGFFIPEVEHVERLDAMLEYIHEKVHVGCMCLYCNNEGSHSFRSGAAVQRHMLDKQHCFLNTEDDEEEYADFYEAREDARPTSLVSRTEELPVEVMETGELRLKSGVILGHKKYARYYKQRLHERPERETRLLAILAEEYQKLEVPADWRGIEKIQKREQLVMQKELMRSAEQTNMLKPFHRAQNPK